MAALPLLGGLPPEEVEEETQEAEEEVEVEGEEQAPVAWVLEGEAPSYWEPNLEASQETDWMSTAS